MLYKYALFNDGIPPSTGVTHLIREVDGRWEIVANLSRQGIPTQELVDQLNAAYDMAITVPAVKGQVRQVINDVRVVAGLPTMPIPPDPPKPPAGLNSMFGLNGRQER
jgi:hypothetical protein